MFILSILPDVLAICRLKPNDAFPTWGAAGSLLSVTRTADELSVICSETIVPDGILADKGWRALKVQGPLDFALVGVLAELAGLLASAKVSIFAVSTFDTDYILVKQTHLRGALEALRRGGHQVSGE
ncbi:MAG: ACT domain-containing protein [Anaerolineales bacterium]